MLELTKIFRFEMAHAIHAYEGPCSNIHGHSYTLYVTVAAVTDNNGYLPPPGFIMDFKELKSIVTESCIRKFDHKLILSRNFSEAFGFVARDNTIIWEYEPTAENLILHIRQALAAALPPAVQLIKLKLYETMDSYVTWINNGHA